MPLRLLILLLDTCSTLLIAADNKNAIRENVI